MSVQVCVHAKMGKKYPFKTTHEMFQPLALGNFHLKDIELGILVGDALPRPAKKRPESLGQVTYKIMKP